jgi:hypothetical protein
MFYVPEKDKHNTDLSKVMKECKPNQEDDKVMDCTFTIDYQQRFGWLLGPKADGYLGHNAEASENRKR